MAKKKTQSFTLPLDTIITVVAKKGDKVIRQDMPYQQALDLLKKKSGYSYSFYQLGFCMVKEQK